MSSYDIAAGEQAHEWEPAARLPSFAASSRPHAPSHATTRLTLLEHDLVLVVELSTAVR